MRKVWNKTDQKFYKSMADAVREIAREHNLDINYDNPHRSWLYCEMKRHLKGTITKNGLGTPYVVRSIYGKEYTYFEEKPEHMCFAMSKGHNGKELKDNMFCEKCGKAVYYHGYMSKTICNNCSWSNTFKKRGK